eukprot:2680478-Amphidinium_carterae.1
MGVLPGGKTPFSFGLLVPFKDTNLPVSRQVRNAVLRETRPSGRDTWRSSRHKGAKKAGRALQASMPSACDLWNRATFRYGEATHPVGAKNRLHLLGTHAGRPGGWPVQFQT